MKKAASLLLKKPVVRRATKPVSIVDSEVSDYKLKDPQHTFLYTDPLNVRKFGTTAPAVAYKLPDLEFDYKALEPVISGEIMELHHKKHHQTYVTNLNASLEKYADAEAKKDLGTMIQLQGAIKFNGGGHVNHSIFWTNLAPANKDGGVAPGGELAQKINAQFGSIDKFIEKFSAQTVAIQGSGWGWLGYNKAEDKLVVTTMTNQDPLSIQGLVPLLGIDVWEHAYYLQYKNVRADYVKNIWKVVNWKNVAERLAAAKK